MAFPTQEQIVQRLKDRQSGDAFGFECNEYLRALDFEHAREFLKTGATEKDWSALPDIRSRDDAIKVMQDYLDFAFEKANDCRGISANRSVMHYIAWAWLAGDTEFAEKLDASFKQEYAYYGKPQLVMVAEHYGFNWRQYDNDNWTSHEGELGPSADRVLGRVPA